MFVIFGLILIPFMSLIPRQNRLKMLDVTQKLTGALENAR